jgi:hypothetical protein
MPSRGCGARPAARCPRELAFTSPKPGVSLMNDLLYIALSAVLFSLTWGLVRICDSV